MQIDELKILIAATADTRRRMHVSHEQLLKNRNPERYAEFINTVNSFNKVLSQLPYYMRSYSCRKGYANCHP